MELDELLKIKKSLLQADENTVTGISIANLIKIVDLAIIGVKSRDKN